MTVIRLRCIDERVLEVDAKVAEVSGTVRSMMDDLVVEDGEEIPLPKVESPTLEKVLEWAERHKDDPPTEDPEEIRERTLNRLTDWDKQFLDVDQSTLLDIILAANYLDMPALLDAACKTVGDLIGGKTPDEIRAVIENDSSSEEEQRIENDSSSEEEQRIEDEIECEGDQK